MCVANSYCIHPCRVLQYACSFVHTRTVLIREHGDTTHSDGGHSGPESDGSHVNAVGQGCFYT